MDCDERMGRFVQLLTDHQRGLFAYVVSLLGDLNEAQNVLQETNLVLWRRSAEFVEGTSFVAWARKVAYYQVLAHLRLRKRDRHIFDPALLEQLTDRFSAVEEDDRRRLALRHCLAELPDKLRAMIALRYGPGGSLKILSLQMGKSEGAIKMALLRIREQLVGCMERKLASEE
jgi:RNA polymerase sigma-70 factor (ECF subfamily)